MRSGGGARETGPRGHTAMKFFHSPLHKSCDPAVDALPMLPLSDSVFPIKRNRAGVTRQDSLEKPKREQLTLYPQHACATFN